MYKICNLTFRRAGNNSFNANIYCVILQYEDKGLRVHSKLWDQLSIISGAQLQRR